MLGASELAAMRAEQELLMVDDVKVYRRTRSLSTALGTSTESLTLQATLKGHVYAGHGWPAESEQAARMTGKRWWIAALPHGTALSPSDVLVWSGRTFEVVGGMSGGHLATAARYLCTEREAD